MTDRSRPESPVDPHECPPDLAGALLWGQRRLAGSGVDNPGLDAALLLGRATGTERARLYLEPRRLLDRGERERFGALLTRRAAREPVQYILRRQEFMGLEFEVDERVLIPRPETEILVETALELLRGRAGSAAVADLGTGSGAIAVSIACLHSPARVWAVDLSPPTLEVAAANAARHGVRDRIEFRQGDLLAPLAGQCFSLVACNPPYVGADEIGLLQPEVHRFEPRLALVPPARGEARPDPLHFYRRLAAEVPGCLEPGGWLVVEVGAGQAPAVQRLLAGTFAVERAVRDYGGHVRVLAARPRGHGRAAGG